MPAQTLDSHRQVVHVGSGDVDELGRRLERIFSRQRCPQGREVGSRGFHGVQGRPVAGDRIAKVLGLIAARLAQPVSA